MSHPHATFIYSLRDLAATLERISEVPRTVSYCICSELLFSIIMQDISATVFSWDYTPAFNAPLHTEYHINYAVNSFSFYIYLIIHRPFQKSSLFTAQYSAGSFTDRDDLTFEALMTSYPSRHKSSSKAPLRASSSSASNILMGHTPFILLKIYHNLCWFSIKVPLPYKNLRYPLHNRMFWVFFGRMCTAVKIFICQKNTFWRKWQTNKKQSWKRRYLPLSGLFFAVVNSYRNSKML